MHTCCEYAALLFSLFLFLCVSPSCVSSFTMSIMELSFFADGYYLIVGELANGLSPSTLSGFLAGLSGDSKALNAAIADTNARSASAAAAAAANGSSSFQGEAIRTLFFLSFSRQTISFSCASTFSCHSFLTFCCLYNHVRSSINSINSRSIIRVQASLCRRRLGVAVADARGRSADGSVRARPARLACGHFPGLAPRPHPRPRPEQPQQQRRW